MPIRLVEFTVGHPRYHLHVRRYIESDPAIISKPLIESYSVTCLPYPTSFSSHPTIDIIHARNDIYRAAINYPPMGIISPVREIRRSRERVPESETFSFSL